MEFNYLKFLKHDIIFMHHSKKTETIRLSVSSILS